jgi:hypothetical protein
MFPHQGQQLATIQVVQIRQRGVIHERSMPSLRLQCIHGKPA